MPKASLDIHLYFEPRLYHLARAVGYRKQKAEEEATAEAQPEQGKRRSKKGKNR